MPTPGEVQARESRTHKMIKLINKDSDGGYRIDKLDLSHPVHHSNRFIASDRAKYESQNSVYKFVNKAREANESDSDKKYRKEKDRMDDVIEKVAKAAENEN